MYGTYLYKLVLHLVIFLQCTVPHQPLLMALLKNSWRSRPHERLLWDLRPCKVGGKSETLIGNPPQRSGGMSQQTKTIRRGRGCRAYINVSWNAVITISGKFPAVHLNSEMT